MAVEAKAFFNVFTELSVEKELNELFMKVDVLKAVMNQKDNILSFHICCRRLIHHANILAMEQAIKSKLFSQSKVIIKLVEIYRLSEQYTTSKLTDIYMESLLFELQEKSQVLYNIMRKAEWTVEGDIITILLEDSFLAKNKSDEIKDFLVEVYQQRFHINVKVGFDYSESQFKAIQEAKRHKLMLEVNNVMSQVPELIEPPEEVKAPARKPEAKRSFAEQKENRYRASKQVEDKDVFYGRSCDGDAIPMEEINDEIGEVVVRGKIISIDTREIRMEKTIIMFNITDFTDTVTVKIFVKNVQLPEILGLLKKGGYYKVKGMAVFDKFDKEIGIGSVMGIKAIPDFTAKRMDTSLEKRVELHLHTTMSDLDSVVDIHTMIDRAKAWGMPAVAITDHGCLQAFPIANHCISKDEPFKVIYGVEGYFVDDLKEVVTRSKGQALTSSFVVFDIETTGFSPLNNRIIEIGAVKVVNGKIIERFSEFVNPEVPIPFHIETLTSITDKMVIGAETIEAVLPKFLEFCQGSVMVAHNADFDMSFIEANAARLDLECHFTYLDTVALARVLLPELSRFRLNTVAKHLKIPLENHHRAVDDAEATAQIFERFLKILEAAEVTNLDGVNKMAKASKDAICKAPTNHGIILVKNETGRINLNRLVSISHLEYFNRRPKMPKSLIEKYREGLIIGAACEAGELYQAVLNGRSQEEIARIVNFYDYLEIQPLGNNEFMLKSDRYTPETKADLMEINRKIVALGEAYNKPVVATCDVHFLDPEDEIYRRIIMAGKGFKDADDQPPLYLRTTEEMLDEFAYLGSDKAREVVITNTNLINDQIEKISPVLPDKCPPVIENSDEELRNICYTKAHEIYGDNLPEQVESRLEKELHSIISNGFAVMYIIAQKLVWDSNDHGYLVGSRGSVGSSFAATMAGITEVNPLPAHYICPQCHYSDFESEAVQAYAKTSGSGYDMPDADCPKCGHAFIKEGHDIPFETFLGFYGDKEPDIDLNFSGDYQAKAHAYVEEIFGKGKAYRAGTIGTMAEKTAYGYVYKYYEERELHKRRCEMERIAMGCTGVKRTTGQHPGGIIVVPHDREIYEFTAIQHPANDTNTPIITTHFEYHSIDHNLLKLDILGHDDPTMIRNLENLTGVSSQTIRFDDPDVMSLFHSTEKLGIKPEDIGGIPLGCLGVPEFGTEFVIGMVQDAAPKNFSDLIRISGLSHGTDVWLNNAQDLIEEGKATLSSAICTRDDIMTYLIKQGVENSLSFTIMESVRKGKGLKPEWEEAMIKEGVPDWYIESCKRIKYMFPKAHAAAYVMMGWRIAWYKIFHPLAYYASYFGIRSSAFSYETMCQGRDRLEHYMAELQSQGKNNLTNKDLDSIKDMRIVQEMYARGYEFAPIDLNVVDDKAFQIIDGKIMPALSSIDGLGEKAAEGVVEAVKDGPFLSRDDFRNRAKVSKTVTEKMGELGILGDIPESNQLSFEFLM